MKKLILVAGLIAATSQMTQAQELTYAPEVGINIAKQSGDGTDNLDYKIGLKAGAVVNIPAGGGFYLQPGLFYTQKGFKSSTELLGIKTDANLNIGYIELPVNVQYRFDLVNAGAVFLTAGPYAAYAVNGQLTTKGSALGVEGETKTKVEFGNELSETKPFDWGFNFGVGYELPFGLYVRGQYGLGLGNMSNVDNMKRTNSGIQVTLGYLLGRGY